MPFWRYVGVSLPEPSGMRFRPQGFEGGIVLADCLALQSQAFGALAHPDARYLFVLAVIVIGGQMIAQVGAAVLDLGAGKHSLIQSRSTAHLSESC